MNFFKQYVLTSILFSFLILTSCSKDPQPINFGVDDCDYCKMTISDTRFGAEIVTDKGRIYKFDDVVCAKGFLNDEIIAEEQVHSIWFVDFMENETLVNADSSVLIYNEELKSPMASNIAAFGNELSLKEYQSQFKGQILKWEDYLKSQ